MTSTASKARCSVSWSTAAVAAPAARPARALHLLDVENLCGPHRDPQVVSAVCASYLTSQVAPGDHLVAATGPALAATAWFALPARTRRLVGHGLDGADLALLTACGTPAWIAQRYTRLVIASGDRAFALLARAATTAGVQVSVVTGHGRLSHALARHATHHQLPL